MGRGIYEHRVHILKQTFLLKEFVAQRCHIERRVMELLKPATCVVAHDVFQFDGVPKHQCEVGESGVDENVLLCNAVIVARLVPPVHPNPIWFCARKRSMSCLLGFADLNASVALHS